MPICLCCTFASELYGSSFNNLGEPIALGGFLHDMGYFDRIGAIPIFYSGALVALVGTIVVGPRYGMFMSAED